MTDTLLKLNNPNADIMVIPIQEGGSDDDQYFGSIGDATMNHVYSLSDGGKQMWSDLYVAGSGAMFRPVTNTSWHDSDPFNLKGKDLDLWVAEYVRKHYDGDIPEKDLITLSEAIAEEQERRELSEDVYDADDATTVPYDDWEKFPQMWNAWETPSTPRDIMIYMGNTRDSFYDSRPDGHVDEAVINQYLQRLNRDWDVLDSEEADQYCDYLTQELSDLALIGAVKDYTAKYLILLVDKIKTDDGDANDAVEWALSNIDRCWSIEYTNQVAEDMREDKIFQLMLHKQSEWKRQVDQGVSVYANVKALGQALYQHHMDDMKNHHWAFYKRLKMKHSPNITVRGVNINHGTLGSLEKLTGSRETATKIWFARPFDSVAHVFEQRLISKKVFAENEGMEKMLERIDGFAKKVETSKNLQNFQPIVKAMIDGQKTGSLNMGSGLLIKPTGSEWSLIWAYYRMTKQSLEDIFAKETAAIAAAKIPDPVKEITEYLPEVLPETEDKDDGER